MSRSEDSFEEYNLDNESLDSKSFEEKGDIEPMKVSDLTKKLSEWNIYISCLFLLLIQGYVIEFNNHL